MKTATIKARAYRHSEKYKFILDLRAFGKGRTFFKTRAEAEAEAMRQRVLLERHSREAVGLSRRELSGLIAARNKLAEYGETIEDAVQFRVDHLDRVLRHGVTVSELAAEVVNAKQRDGRAKIYVDDLRKRLNRFCQDFGSRTVAGITIAELDNWLRDLPLSPKSRANYRANVGVLFSYALYRLAAINDAPRVAAELGHTSPQMLYSTYREVVLPAEADRYWQIAPQSESEKVVAFSASPS